jgi:hypothetical protein
MSDFLENIADQHASATAGHGRGKAVAEITLRTDTPQQDQFVDQQARGTKQQGQGKLLKLPNFGAGGDQRTGNDG